MDDPKQRSARLELAKGIFGTIELEAESSEYDIRNALSRCYYSFFHLGHALLGRYYNHDRLPTRVAKVDKSLGEFIKRLHNHRIEADYDPDLIEREYNGRIAAYRLKATEVLSEATARFEEMLRLAEQQMKPARGSEND